MLEPKHSHSARIHCLSANKIPGRLTTIMVTLKFSNVFLVTAVPIALAQTPAESFTQIPVSSLVPKGLADCGPYHHDNSTEPPSRHLFCERGKHNVLKDRCCGSFTANGAPPSDATIYWAPYAGQPVDKLIEEACQCYYMWPNTTIGSWANANAT